MRFPSDPLHLLNLQRLNRCILLEKHRLTCEKTPDPENGSSPQLSWIFDRVGFLVLFAQTRSLQEKSLAVLRNILPENRVKQTQLARWKFP